jgi:hypothetical protein
MMTNTESRKERRIGALTSDLSRTLGERQLLKMVLEAVQGVAPGRFSRKEIRSAEFRPQMMLTLLTYCYTASSYGSYDVEWAISHDKTVRYICAHTYPDWHAIRRFRRQHREVLQETIASVLKQAWACKFDEGELPYKGYEWFESELLDQVRAAAMERLDLAALLDGADSD